MTIIESLETSRNETLQHFQLGDRGLAAADRPKDVHLTDHLKTVTPAVQDEGHTCAFRSGAQPHLEPRPLTCRALIGEGRGRHVLDRDSRTIEYDDLVVYPPALLSRDHLADRGAHVTARE